MNLGLRKEIYDGAHHVHVDSEAYSMFMNEWVQAVFPRWRRWWALFWGTALIPPGLGALQEALNSIPEVVDKSTTVHLRGDFVLPKEED